MPGWEGKPGARKVPSSMSRKIGKVRVKNRADAVRRFGVVTADKYYRKPGGTAKTGAWYRSMN